MDRVQTEGYLSRNSLTPTVFHNEWWLDIASEGNWSRTKCYMNGKLVGWLPFFSHQRMLQHRSGMPTLTHFLGPAIDPGTGGQTTRFSRSASITRSLIRDLPHFSCFSQKMHRGIDDVIPFQDEGFNTAVQFTFELSPKHPDMIWHTMRDKTRNVIRNAQKVYAVHSDIQPQDFVAFYSNNINARNMMSSIDLRIMLALIESCYVNECGLILAAMDKYGIMKASVFCAWDDVCYYYLLSTRAAGSGNGVISLLLWNHIRKAVAKGRIFDFDGLSDGSSVSFYSGFGGKSYPRYTVSKLSPSFRLLREVRRLVRADNFFTDNN